jgi:hypothetical protein
MVQVELGALIKYGISLFGYDNKRPWVSLENLLMYPFTGRG